MWLRFWLALGLCGKLEMKFILLSFLVLGGCGAIGVDRQEAQSERVSVARANQQVGDFAEAARLYELELEMDPNSIVALVGLGETLTASGQYSRANQILTSASTRYPNDTSILLARGELELLRKRPVEALMFFERVLYREKANLRGILGRGVSLDFLSRHRDAQLVYLEGLARYPSHFGLQNNYGLSLVLSNDVARGIGLLEDLFRTPERGEAVRINLSLGYYLSGRRSDARALLSGVMTDSEINMALSRFENIRSEFLLGRPIGYLIFN